MTKNPVLAQLCNIRIITSTVAAQLRMKHTQVRPRPSQQKSVYADGSVTDDASCAVKQRASRALLQMLNPLHVLLVVPNNCSWSTAEGFESLQLTSSPGATVGEQVAPCQGIIWQGRMQEVQSAKTHHLMAHCLVRAL